MFRWLIFITATGLLIASSTTSAAAADRDVVTVRLRARAKLTGADVTVADIASLEGGPALMRHQIGSLDIATIEEAATGAEISRRRVFFRIRLAGVAQQAFRLVGADSCRLEKQASQFMDEQIIDAIVKELANKWSLPADQILVRLTAPLREPIPAEHRGEPTELRAIIPLPFYPGNQRIKIGVYQHGNLLSTHPVESAVRVRRPVATVVRPVGRGQLVTATDVTIRVEELIGKRALTVADHPVGQVAQTPLYANKVLEQKDVAPASRVTGPNSNRGPLVKVKRGTTVRLVARKGALKVELAAAKLLDNAAVGDRVTVENPDSKKQIVGQLVAKDVVRIDF